MVSAVTAKAAQLGVMGVLNFPATSARVGQLSGVVVAESSPDARVSQMAAMVVYRGRVDDPRLQVWTFTLDGHDFYVLRLGDSETLVYDTYSQKWSVWGSGVTSRWKAKTGCNWLGAGGGVANYDTTIVAGDEAAGTLYFLDSEYPLEDAASEDASPAPFQRSVQGQIVQRGRAPVDCFSVALSGSFGRPWDTSLNDVSLSYSDDDGQSYADAGTISIPLGDSAARVEWRSLGIVKTPGRLFLIEDNGALARIDSLDLDNG